MIGGYELQTEVHNRLDQQGSKKDLTRVHPPIGHPTKSLLIFLENTKGNVEKSEIKALKLSRKMTA